MGPREREDASGTRRRNHSRAATGGEGTGARREAAAHVTKNGAGNGIRTRDFDLGKVALYH